MSEEDENIDMVEDIGLVKKEISKPIDAKKDEKEEKDVSSEIDKWLEEDKKAAESGDLPKLNIPKKEDKPVEKEKIEDIPKQDVEEDSEEEVTIATSSNKEAALPNLSKNKNEVTVTVLGEKKEELLEDKQVYADEAVPETKIFGLRTTANREDQVMTFVTSNAERKGINIYSVIRPHGMRGYIFVEAPTRSDAEQAAYGIPYARGILPSEIEYKEIEHMLEQVKKEVNIQKGDIAEIISGPFKREKAKITRVDKVKEEVVVELLEAAVPIPITVKLDAVKVIRRDKD